VDQQVTEALMATFAGTGIPEHPSKITLITAVAELIAQGAFDDLERLSRLS
jgi:hypothetical protein